MEQETKETREQPSKPEVIGAVPTVGVLGFWFGTGAALGPKMGPCRGLGFHRDPMVNSLEELISRQ